MNWIVEGIRGYFMLLKPLLFCLLVLTFSSIQAVPTLNQSDDFDLAVKAIKERNVSELKMLLEKDRRLVEKADDKFGATLLHWAAVEKDVGIIKLLLEYNPRLGAQNKENATPLMLALVPNPSAERDAGPNNKEVLKLLFDIATCELRNSADKTALHLAAEYGDEETVLMLLKLGADPIAKSQIVKEPWYYARNVLVKKILKEKAAERTAENFKISLLEYAETGNLEGLKSLLQLAGNRINLNSTNARKETPLIVAARNSHYEVVAFLIKMGADIKLQDASNLTVWDHLCKKKN